MPRGTHEEVEKKLVEKIKIGELTDENQVRKAAVEMSKVAGFKASKGWFSNFSSKYGVNWHESSGAKHSPC